MNTTVMNTIIPFNKVKVFYCQIDYFVKVNVFLTKECFPIYVFKSTKQNE